MENFISNEQQNIENNETNEVEHNFSINLFISSFEQIPPNYTENLNLLGNPISDWDGIHKHTSLKTLNISNTFISDFKNDFEFPPISEIYLEQTPLSKLPFYKEMTVLAFGFQLKKINGNYLEDEFLINLRQMDNLSEIQEKLRQGYVLSSISTDRLSFRKKNVLFDDSIFLSTSQKTTEITNTNKTVQSAIEYLKENHDKPFKIAAKCVPFITRKCELFLRDKNDEISTSYQLKISRLEKDMKDKEEAIADIENEYEILRKQYFEVTKKPSNDSILIQPLKSSETSFDTSFSNSNSHEIISCSNEDVEQLKQRLSEIEIKYNDLLQQNETLREKHSEFLKLFNTISESNATDISDIPIDSLVSLPL